MKKEIARIKADDGGVKMWVRIEARCNGALLRHELEDVVLRLARKIASEDLPALRYTDFGAENTQVKA